MDYQNFSNLADKIKKSKLGGEAAQFKLAPEMRKLHTVASAKNKSYRKAAVLALFYPNKEGKTHLLLTLRANYKGTHSAQVSFPGGKFEASDLNLSQTALRECYEEVGISTTQIELIKEMSNVYIPPSNFMVTPFIGFSDTYPVFKTNHEVAELIEVPLSNILDDAFISYKNMRTSDSENNTIPYFNLNNHTVWGATAMIISEIKELLKTL